MKPTSIINWKGLFLKIHNNPCEYSNDHILQSFEHFEPKCSLPKYIIIFLQKMRTMLRNHFSLSNKIFTRITQQNFSLVKTCLELAQCIDHIQKWKIHEKWNPFHGRFTQNNWTLACKTNKHLDWSQLLLFLCSKLENCSFHCETDFIFLSFFSVACCPFYLAIKLISFFTFCSQLQSIGIHLTAWWGGT